MIFKNQGLSNNTPITNMGFHVLPLVIHKPIMYKEDAFQFTVWNLISSRRSRLAISSLAASFCLSQPLSSTDRIDCSSQTPIYRENFLPSDLKALIATTGTPPPPPLVDSHICLLAVPPSSGLSWDHTVACFALALLPTVGNWDQKASSSQSCSLIDSFILSFCSLIYRGIFNIKVTTVNKVLEGNNGGDSDNHIISLS